MSSLSKWLIAMSVATALVLGWAFYTEAWPQAHGPNSSTGLCETVETIQAAASEVFGPTVPVLVLEAPKSKVFTDALLQVVPSDAFTSADVGTVTLVSMGGKVAVYMLNLDGCYIQGITLPSNLVESLVLNGS